MKSVASYKINIINNLLIVRRVFLSVIPLLLFSLKGSGQMTSEFFASATSICSGSAVTFTDNSIGATDTTLYNWSFGTGASPSTASGRGPHLVNYTGSGNRTVSLTLTDRQSVTRTKTNYITVNPIPQSPVVTVSDNCNSSSTLTTTAQGILLWSTGEMSSAIIVTTPGTYTVTTQVKGCTSLPGSGTATPKSAPPPPIVSVDCSQGTGDAVISISSPAGADYEYKLNNGSFQRNTTFTKVSNGSHIITVRNGEGCLTTGNYFEVSCECTDGATVTLSEVSGKTCSLTPVTVTGNTFGGRAGWVTITENGDGSVSPTLSLTSPFTFTYTPKKMDEGKIITITVTTNNPSGSACAAAKETYLLNVSAVPAAPGIGTITQPACSDPSGSILLDGLPATGRWTLLRTPGEVTTVGAGTSITIPNLQTGTYTYTVLSERGCISKPSADIVINPQPVTPIPPIVGIVTQPTCTISNGSVELSGLPETGTWSLVRNPGAVTTNGSGTDKTISNLPGGIHFFSVINSNGCSSLPSVSVLINSQLASPSPPIIGTIIPPTCTLSTGSVELKGLSSTGTWVLTRYPGTIISTGTGTTIIISNLQSGVYNFTQTNIAGCMSSPSANVVIPLQPTIPAAPLVGAITLPSCSVPSGSLVLNGLPASGEWTVTRIPDGMKTTGTGTNKTIPGQSVGTYTYTVTNAAGCISEPSTAVTIPQQPGIPLVKVTDPAGICSPLKADLTASGITSGSTPGLTFSYWRNVTATIPYLTPGSAGSGTYYIKGTTTAGCFDIKPVVVTVNAIPEANAGPDQYLEYKFETIMDADQINEFEKGIWSVISGTAEFVDQTNAKTLVNELSPGENEFLWTVTNEGCPEAFDTVMITIKDLEIRTMITPNMDGKNDYLIIKGLDILGRAELTVFDRRGIQVYRNYFYDNTWNGIDFDGNPLEDDTYFYVLKTENGRSVRGFIVIRR